MTGDRVDPDDLRALVTPTRDGKWRFDISGTGIGGDALWMLTDVDSYGWARTRERAEEKARKRLAKMRARLANLARPSSVVR